MCGIVGLLALNPTAQVSRDDLARAGELLRHRGPDDAGVYMGEGVGLAARRLSIIDLEGGHQPLSNEDGTVWIAYNGEVYNAPQLRTRLLAAGHQFRTQTDTETVIHAYEEWGEAAVERLRGMFAFALWDGRRERLLLARDRFGIKPLYYARDGGRLAFASEIRPLLAALPGMPRRMETAALESLFRQGYIPSPLTAFASVQALPAAHLLVAEKGGLRVQRYWQLTYPRLGEHWALPAEEAIEKFMALLCEAVEAWRMSDVPVGSLLSGGIDSAALAALLTEVSGGPIQTFNIAFSAASHDESALARETARYIGSRHHELTFTPADFDHLPHVVRHLESPLCSATSVPIYLLYKACHEAGFKVILTGEGADELLGGYHWFEGDKRVRPLLNWPHPVRALLARLPGPASAAGRRVLAQGSGDPVQRFGLWQQVASPELIGQLLMSRLSRAEREADKTKETMASSLAGRHPLEQFLYLEATTRMTDFINFEVDRMSMASSVEARPPFLDHRLWEFCARLPPEYKLNGTTNKWLLREGLAGRLPDAVRRRSKKGLATPHAAWWRVEKLPAWAEACLEPAALVEGGYFQSMTVARLRAEHLAGRADHSRILTGILTTQLWHEAL